MRSAFLNSFAVRDGKAFSEETRKYINEEILSYTDGWPRLLDVLLLVTTKSRASL